MNRKQKPKDEIKVQLGIIRDIMKDQGVYDGRFRSKTYETKKRKNKYLKKHHVEDEYIE
jgi:hypothetical protein